MIAFFAILMDSYRSLKAQKLFVTVLILSLLVIIGYGSFGFDETGVFVLFGAVHIDNDYFRTGTPLAATLYTGVFSAFIVNLWLAWIATILALISTSSTFPRFISEGAVELTMSKPIRRTTMFIAKYVGGLLFVVLQVGLFCIGAFFVTGWRIGEWNTEIFLAIPLITVFFSYLFCVTTLVGVITRSTLVALLFTLLFWFGTFAVRTADDALRTAAIQSQSMLDTMTRSLAARDDELSSLREQNQELEVGGSEAGETYYRSQIQRLENTIEDDRRQLESRSETVSQIQTWTTVLGMIRRPLPETSRTIGLLDRWVNEGRSTTMNDILSGAYLEDEERRLAEEADVAADVDGADRAARSGPRGPEGGWQARRESRRKAESRLAQLEEEMSPASIIGGSLLFELVVLILAWWVFIRRDY